MTSVHPLYQEAAEAELISVGKYRQTAREVKLRRDAAAACTRLMAEARAAGVAAIPISGFRSYDYQAALVQKAIVKHGSEAAALRWVALPGHSEHHTGLAIDLGDETTPNADIEVAFEQTPSFQWLKENAQRFDFELSYPPGNSRNINYEPWHWRFVGTPDAKLIFEQ